MINEEIRVDVTEEVIELKVEVEEPIVEVKAIGEKGQKGDKGDPGDVADVKVNNVSVVSQGIANIDLSSIEEKIPSQASSSNQLADKNFVNSSINSVTAYYITKDASGNQFNTKAELNSATTFYSGGQVRVPTRNDYCIVIADETKTDATTGENPTTRYIYQNNQWEFQYIVNKTSLTASQLASLNSGITSSLVTQIGTNQTNIANKQDKITSSNKLAYSLISGTPTIPSKTSDLTNDSGYITSSYHDSSKQDTLTTQTAYTNKGSATKVPKITTNTLGQVTSISEVTITQPTVNNATLTIQKNGTTVNTFTANASSNVTANITVPTKTSEITNDSGFLTSHQDISGKLDKTSVKTTQTTSATDTYSCNYINGVIPKYTLLYDFGTMSSYSEGDVSINVSNYDLIVIEDADGFTTLASCKNGKCHGIMINQDWTSNADNILRRKFWKISNGGVHIDKCYGYGINGYTSFGERSTYLIPRYIYGIKF